ncbi:MAG: extracellular solute-binding protein [Alicyclobacillus sp.]|nr:extracellular solute-binding protein [Alicyclobacillus sp.]
MKLRMLALGISMAGLFALVGCGGSPPAPGGESGTNSTPAQPSKAELDWAKTDDPSLKGQTITVLWTDTNGIRKKLIQQFEHQTGIHVNEIGVSYNQVYDKVMTAAQSGSSDIDVVEMDTIWAGQYLKGHVAVDLSQVVPDNVKSQFTKSSLSSVTYDGHLMAVPWFSSTKHFYWNTKLLKDAGISSPPKTWDEFYQDSLTIQRKLGSKGIYASGWSWKQAESLTCDYVGFVGAFGGKFFENGKPEFSKGGDLDALKYMVKLMKSGTVDPASLQWDENDVANAFVAGKIAMMSNWDGVTAGWNDPKQSKIVGQWQAGLLPGEGSVTSSACTGSEGVAIMQNSKHKEAALAFLKWIASPQYQREEYEQEGQFPSLKSLYAELSKKDALINTYADEFNYGVNRPNAPGYVQWSDILQAALHNALSGQGTPEQDLQSADTQIASAIQANQ